MTEGRETEKGGFPKHGPQPVKLQPEQTQTELRRENRQRISGVIRIIVRAIEQHLGGLAALDWSARFAKQRL